MQKRTFFPMQYPIVNHHLVAELEVFGVSDDLKRKVPGYIDTGFSGYLSIPFVTAFPIGLILKGQQSYTLADGSTSHYFVCLGTVTLLGKSAVVPIDIQPSGPVLIGTQLMKKLGIDLTTQFDKDVFELVVRRGR
jgi:predicted aspartyl protease